MPARELSGVREPETPGICQAAEAALSGVRAATLLPSAVTSTEEVRTGTSTPRPLTPSVPLVKLLGWRGLTRALLLLTLATTRASSLRGATPTSATATTATAATAATATTATTAAAATATSTPTTAAAAASASTAATRAPASATTPTSTPTPPATSTATTTTPASSSSTLAPLALAAAAPPARGRRSTDRLSAKEVDSSSRGNRGQKGNGGAPLKERGTRVTPRGSYSEYALLSCKELLREEVNGESGRADSKEVVPDRAKGVREPGD
ncbi:unnamed protein product [Closterium sp. Yama58-4]|nr:unnamed protein product [Closterium sp. Yama58-4]